METVRIQNGQTERIEVLALDANGSPAAGLTNVLLAIRRISDGKWLDFADNTFKSSSWTTRQVVMTEISASLDAGKYYYSFNTAGFADDAYEMRAECASAGNFPQNGELKAGGFPNNLDAAVSSRGSQNDVTAIKAKTDNLPADTDAALKTIQALCGKNSRMFNTQYDSDHNLLSATIRGYASKADCEADTNPVVELTLAATYSGPGEATAHVMKDSA